MLAVKQVSTVLDVSPYKRYGVKIEHSLYKMLDFQGVPCNNEKSYRLDKCILKGLEEESLKTIGCVTPFGFTTDRICQNEQNSKKALQLYHEYRNDNMATKIFLALSHAPTWESSFSKHLNGNQKTKKERFL